MSEQRWTPGPWRQVTGVGYCAIRTNAGVIADMRFVDRYYNPFDANLIAAAPSMIDALMQWRNAEAMGDESEIENARRSRDKAISEALGEK